MASKIKIEIETDGKKARSEFNSTADAIDALSGKTNKADAAFASFAKTMGTALLAGGAAAVAGLGVAIKSAGDYESSLSRLKQAAGATAEEMAAMSEMTRKLGQDNDLAGVSAADVAATMVELSKAGLSVKDTMASTKAVMSLAKAGNIEYADAATIAASALNAFGLEGKDAVLVADMLAAGANASQADLSDLALGLQQSATVAKQFKLSLNENVTALALFANNGIKGSDAGTSLKTMLIALAKPSDAAAAAMQQIGFKAYDAQGNFVGLDEMSKRLAKSTSKLTAEQKQNTLAAIFGTDAFRAAAVLSDNAGESYDKMSKSVGKAGSAQQAAAAQMGAYEKATEGMKNAASELGLAIGTKALPYVTRMTQGATEFISTVTNGLPGAISVFKTLIPTITSLTVGLVAFTAVQNAALAKTQALAVAQGALNFVMRANPLALAAGAAAALITAYVGIVTSTDSATSSTGRLKAAMDAHKQSTDALRMAEQSVTDARLAREGSDIAVQRAEQRLNELKATGTATALDLKEAEYNLAVAKDTQRQASEKEAKAVDDANAAKERDRKNAAAVVAANDSISGSASRAAGGYDSWAKSINKAAEARQKGDFKSSVPSLTGNPLANAVGTGYSRGGATLVGENGPELVNMPQGARVTQAYRTRNELNDGGGGVTNNLNGNFTFSTAESVSAFFNRLDASGRLARSAGM
ncbi:phage tail tape measure protein [Rhodococcus sp. IEGM 1374]|nr:phage tail tape measure protein [Rhodococcus sp. IEGM 1374]MDV7992057.1 phage tail tape measure protein [Rhodococcus sp. IEGM 1374]